MLPRHVSSDCISKPAAFRRLAGLVQLRWCCPVYVSVDHWSTRSGINQWGLFWCDKCHCSWNQWLVWPHPSDDKTNLGEPTASFGQTNETNGWFPLPGWKIHGSGKHTGSLGLLLEQYAYCEHNVRCKVSRARWSLISCCQLNRNSGEQNQQNIETLQSGKELSCAL